MATTERGNRGSLEGNVSLEWGQLSLIACSRCLRVLRDEQWVDAELVIRELRSFEHGAPPRFEPLLCPICTRSLQLARVHARLLRLRDLVRSSGRR